MLVLIIDAPRQVKAGSGLNIVGDRPAIIQVQAVRTPYVINKPGGRKSAGLKAVDTNIVLTNARE
eukprot:7750394-Heterocapsa_arctica.AAC.1